jgi:hypothetical protein
MSHTGYRYSRRRPLVFQDARPKQVTIEDITKGGKLDGHIYEGEFQGNAVTVLTGLSTSQAFDIDNVLNDDEKGVIIGYTPESPYFQLFMNDGLGPKVVYTFPIGSDNKLEVEFDGGNIVFTTKIPSMNDTFYVINYSIY